MSNDTIQLSAALGAYLRSVSLREPEILQQLREETMQLEMARMQIAPEQGQFMGLLLQLMEARAYLEVGTFTGYSALACALAMPEDAEVHALDISEEWTAIARRYWKLAGVSDKITLHLAAATDTLDELVPTRRGQFDAVFIDADKTGYATYIERAHDLLREGGLMMVDNVLWDGAVIDESDNDEDTVAIRAVNKALLSDRRWDISLVPIGDGLTLARKTGVQAGGT